jgi:soluble P-type ATPase
VNQDLAIRRAIADADKKGKLAVVAAITGVSVKRLRQIMKPGSVLSLTESYALLAHLS